MKAVLKFDFNHRHDSTTMHGVVTRSGKFVYLDGVRFKDWGNIKEQFNEHDYLPVIGSKTPDSHLDIAERIIGFGWNFKPNDMTEEMEFDLEYFDDIKNISDLEDPNDLPVSLGFRDDAPLGSGTQKITNLHHIAVSLNANEVDRCSVSGGTACTVSIKTDSGIGRSSSSVKRDLVKLKKKKGDSKKMAKPKKEKKEEEEIVEDAVATPDNVGNTTDPKQNAKSGKASFMLDCQKYGPYPKSQCEAGWKALTAPDTTAPQKGGDDTKSTTTEVKGKSKDMAEVDGRLSKMEKIINDLADIIPTLSAVVQDKNNSNAIKAVEMKEDLKIAGFCGDMVDKITDFNELTLFHQRVTTNKSLFTDPEAEEIRSVNTSRLLGKRKKSETNDFEDMMKDAKTDALSKLYPKGIPVSLGGAQ